MRLMSALFILFMAVSSSIGQEKSGKDHVQITLPHPSTATVSPDTSYELGQQSVQLQEISTRLDRIEPVVEETKRTVDKLLLVYDVSLYFIGTVFTVACSYIVVRLIKKFWPESPSVPPGISDL